MRITLFAAAAATALLLSACGSSSTGTDATADGGAKITSQKKEGDSKPAVEIIDTAHTQNDEYVTGVVLVRANSDDAVGKFVTVSYNVLDGDGQILATEEQIESFSWKGQDIGFPIFVSLDATPGAKAASIDPVVTIDADSFGASDPKEPLPVLKATSIVKEEYGDGFTASFGFTNSSEENLESMRVSGVCFNKAGKVIGGETTYPDAAAGRTIRIDVESIAMVGGAKPHACKAYLNYP